MVFNTGMCLNTLAKKPLPCISLTETNFDFIFLQTLHLLDIYGLLFFVNLPITLSSLVCFFAR